MQSYKNIFFACLCVICLISSISLFGHNKLQILTIDNKDSVYLKVAEGTISGGTITIPVYIESDDDINSLDFSLNYDDTKITYESIIDHTGHIQFTEFYNPADKTLRFTSNSFTQYNTSTKIISIRFKILTECVNSIDFFNMLSYLNGDICSSKLPSEQVCTTSVNDDSSIGNLIKIYPNPASQFVTIEIKEKGVVTLTSLHGVNSVYRQEILPFDLISIDTKNYQSGFYLLILQMGDRRIVNKLIIQH